MDVCNLYGSIPIDEGIEAVMTLIRDNISQINLFGLSLTDAHKLLTHVLSNNFLRFGKQYFKQTTGIAMGSRVAPPVAISFMHSLESSFLSSLTLRPDFLVRYIDDYFGVWSHGLEQLNVFFEKFNNFNPAIGLTLDHTGESTAIPFLDFLLTKRVDHTYSTELYVKLMTAPIITHFYSGHSMGAKKGILKAQIKRAMKLSSDTAARHRSLDKVRKLFEANQYPAALIDQTIRYCDRSQHKIYKNHSESEKFYLKLPYIDEVLCKRVNGVIRASKAQSRFVG